MHIVEKSLYQFSKNNHFTVNSREIKKPKCYWSFDCSPFQKVYTKTLSSGFGPLWCHHYPFQASDNNPSQMFVHEPWSAGVTLWTKYSWLLIKCLHLVGTHAPHVEKASKLMGVTAVTQLDSSAVDLSPGGKRWPQNAKMKLKKIIISQDTLPEP